MNNKLSYIAITIFIFVIGLVLYTQFFETSNLKSNEGYGKNVRVSLTPIEPTKVSVVNVPQDNFPTPTVPVSNFEDKSEPTPTPVVENQLKFRIQDAFGEPIDLAEITYLNKTVSISNGYFSLTEELEQPLTIKVKSEGYIQKEIQVEPIKQKDYTIELEYITDFKVEIFETNDFKKPIPQAKVMLYQGEQAERPIPDSVKICAQGLDHRQKFGMSIVRQHRDAIIQDIYYYNFLTQTRVLPADQIKHLVSSEPTQDSRVIGLFHTNWENGQYSTFSLPEIKLNSEYLAEKKFSSPRLRIWDCLSWLPTEPDSVTRSHRDDLYTIASNNEILRTYVYMPKPSDSLIAVATAVTNNDGIVRFENIKPGLYYVQAILGESISPMAVLHSVRNQVKLVLQQDCRLTIEVKRKGIDLSLVELSGVENLGVQLKSLNSDKQSLNMRTTDSRGKAVFDNLMLGEYQLFIDHPDFQPQTIIVDEPEEFVRIRIDEGYSISGTIFDRDSNEPISGLSIQLVRQERTLDVIQKIERMATGHFRFENLMPGHYYIELLNHFDNVPVYYTSSDINDLNQAVIHFFENESKPIAIVDIQDEDVENIEIYLQKGSQTEFFGKVINQNGEPIAGAYLAMGNFEFEESNPKTDINGNFHLLLNGDNFVSQLSADLYARVGELVPAKMVPWKGSLTNFTTQKEHIQLTAEGSTKVQFRPGDTIQDIVIVIPDEMNKIIGRISTSDQQWPIPIKLNAVQGFMEKESEVKSDGSFLIQGVSPGKIMLFVKTEKHEIITQNFGSYYGYDYVPEQIQIDYPEDQTELYVDVVLEKAGYIGGYVQNENGEPLAGMTVTAQSLQDEMKFKQSQTNRAGQFLLHTIPLNHPYRVDIRESETGSIVESVNEVFPDRKVLFIEM